MTGKVADKTPIAAKFGRRHEDPPGLWIAVAIGSLSLHLLVFWLMRSPSGFRPWFPQKSQDIVPVELIEVAPQPSTSQTTVAPKTTTQDEQTVNLDSSVQQNNTQNESPSETQILAQEKSPPIESTPTPTPTPEATQPTPTPTPTPETTQPTPPPTPPIVPSGDRPWERREDIELGKGTPLPSDTPPVTPEQIAKSQAVEGTTPRTQEEEPVNNSSQESPSSPNEATNSNVGEQNFPANGESTPDSNNVDTPPTPNGETASNSSENNSSSNPETTNNPTAENSPPVNSGGFIAGVLPIDDNEARQLIQQGLIRNRDIPSVFAVYQGNTTKSLDNNSSYLPSNSTLQPAKLLVSLIIDQNGSFQQARVLELPGELQSEKGIYEQIVNDLFKNDSCVPAKNQDGTPLDLSNCYIWVDIKPQTAN
ncbi:hypothetical protein CLI64_10795 [Nostoc sp. CENA543]|uniref:hypothetical protein n=1 Tax=Nostoc sp. CENA543 TaxID=1869241 RepID=UPI000CA1FB25|nr:hypothetical protein [Nostoc sp. CENA543]AUT00844.1 hypothetical protein CLI64_10795 [Nostoc sp. CENA543]